MNIMEKVKILLFGKPIKGEKLPPLKPLKERPFDSEDFYKWCKELNVSRLHGRKPIYLN
jgi:hypothetical protein